MSYLLQLIDCNCNECIFMKRDMDTFNKWKEWNRALQLKDFEIIKAKAIEDAKSQIPYNERFVQKAMNMQFQFNTDGLISYGHCNKFNKPVSFIPGICQLETQDCFEHRKKQ